MFCPLALEQDFPAAQSRAGKDAPMLNSPMVEMDGQLAQAWRAGDTEALRALVDRHRAAAFGLALRLCGDRDRAEDLAQEAFLRAISRIHQYNVRQPFRPWLFRILGHLYIDQLRAVREYAVEAPEPPPGRHDPESDLLVQMVLQSLPPHQRAVLVLRELAGFSYLDLALLLCIPLGAVRSRLAHARAAFKKGYLRLSREEVAR